MESIVSIQDVWKIYRLGEIEVPALRGVSLEVNRGDFIAIAGPSGSGKTTLLNLIGCVDTATRGEVVVNGRRTGQLKERALTSLRLETVGFIFQTFNLVNVLSVYQNVEFPLLLQRKLNGRERKDRVFKLLERVGIAEHAQKRPNELSGGQRQRVAVARALVSDPQIVLADEPTANLDSVTGQQIIDLMKELNRNHGTTFIFSTHDFRVLSHAQSVVRIADGQIQARETPQEAAAHAMADLPQSFKPPSQAGAQ